MTTSQGSTVASVSLVDMEASVQDALDSILTRYPSGPARIQRLQYFCQTVVGAAAAAATTAQATGLATPSSEPSMVIQTVIRQAQQAISDTCKTEGSVVQYKQLFGPPTTTSASTNHSVAPEVTSPQQQTSGSEPMMISESPEETGATNSSSRGGMALGVEYDAAWVEEQEELARQSREVLEHRLQVAQSHLHKESIRTAYLALAQVGGGPATSSTSGGGDWVASFHALLRAKDYCTTRTQTTSICLQIVSLALVLGNTVAAAEYIHKLEHTLRSTLHHSSSSAAAAANAQAGGSGSGGTSSFLTSSHASTELDLILVQTALALERMMCGDFRRALQALMKVVQHEEMETAFAAATSYGSSSGSSTSGEDGTGAHGASHSPSCRNLPYWVAPQDVAMYAAFLCLCHGTTAEMTALADHMSALEWVPLLRQCLVDFGHAKYQACWNCVAVPPLAIRLAVDPFLGPHLPQLLAGMRRKVLQQYWRAYSQVPLAVMAQDLGTSLVPSVDALRQEWLDMILKEQSQLHQHSAGTTATATGTSRSSALKRRNEEEALWSSKSLDDNDLYQQQQALANTRLNLVTDTLHRDSVDDDMIQTHERAQQLSQVTKQVLDDSYATIVRLACQEADIQVLSAAAAAAAYGPDYWRGGRRGRSGAGRSGDHHSSMRMMMDDDDDDDEDDDDLIMAGGAPPGVIADDDADAVVDAMNPEDLY